MFGFDDIAMIQGGMGILSGISSLFGSDEKESGADPQKMQQMADPAGQYRGQWASQLNNLVMNPSSVKDTPGFQFGLETGTGNMERIAAARGGMGGGELAALQSYGNDYASQKWMDQIKMMSGLVGGSSGGGADAYMGALKNQQQQGQAGWEAIGQGVGGLSRMFGGNSTTSSWGTGMQPTVRGAAQGIDSTGPY